MAERFDEWIPAVRWTTRAWSLASVALMLAFIVGEGITASGAAQWIGFTFYPLGVVAGMLLAWKRERVGGWVTVGSLAVFYLVYRATAGTFPPGWGWLVLAAPGFLFLWCSYASDRTRPLRT